MSRSGPTTKDTSAVALGLAQIRVGNADANVASINAVLSAADSLGALGETNYVGTTEYWKLESGFPALEDMTLPLRESAQLDVTYKEITPFNVALSRGLDPTATVLGAVVVGNTNSASGTTTGDITVTETVDNEITEEWTVVFTGAAAGSIFGKSVGHVADFAALDAEITPLHDTDKEYFTIPENFFSGTWQADDTFTFATTATVTGSGSYGDSHSGSIGLGGLKAPEFVRMEAVYTYPNGSNHMYIIFPRANVTGNMELSFQAEDAVAPPMSFEAKRADSETEGGDAAWDSMPLGRIYWD
jgi:hypothetical protein